MTKTSPKSQADLTYGAALPLTLDAAIFLAIYCTLQQAFLAVFEPMQQGVGIQAICAVIRIDRRLRSTDVIDLLSDLFILRLLDIFIDGLCAR